MPSLRLAAGVLDLRHAWRLCCEAEGGANTGVRSQAVGLSALSGTLLGKPLDKCMQVPRLPPSAARILGQHEP